MLTRLALTLFAAGAVAAGASATTTLVDGSRGPERSARPATDAAKPTETTAAADAETDAESAAPVTPPPCPADVANHGDYVSSVARGDGATGALVSAAARDECGKPAAGPRTAEDKAADRAAKDPAKTARRAERDAARADATDGGHGRKGGAPGSRDARGRSGKARPTR